MSKCAHVYKNMGAELCPNCGAQTHEIDWAIQNILHAEYKLANPNGKTDGWWSI